MFKCCIKKNGILCVLITEELYGHTCSETACHNMATRIIINGRYCLLFYLAALQKYGTISIWTQSCKYIRKHTLLDCLKTSITHNKHIELVLHQKYIWCDVYIKDTIISYHSIAQARVSNTCFSPNQSSFGIRLTWVKVNLFPIFTQEKYINIT